MRKILAACLCSLCLSSTLTASLNDRLNDFYNKLGGSANVTAAEIYEGQKAGYATGGGVTIRNRVVNTRPVSVTLPKLDAGCGGIDIYAGGFSFVRRQEIVDSLKSIGSAAVGYSFLLGLETVSPQVANTIKQLQTWSNTINSTGINSCEMAAQLTGAVWPKRTMARQQICRTVGGQTGRFADYVAARHGCADDSQYRQVSQQMAEDSQYDYLLKDAYNIAWEAVRKQSLLQEDQELAELFMTLVGTVIVGEGDNPTIRTFPSKIDDESFLQALLEGGTVQCYACGDNRDKRCLNLKETPLTIEPRQGWISRIRDYLLTIQSKILSDTQLSSQEQEMLSKTRLPLYKIVNIMTAYKKGHSPIDLYQVAEIVAMDLLTQYLREVVTQVREGAIQLRRGQFYADAVDEYLNELSRIERTVRYYETRAMRQMEREFQLMNKIQLIEQQLAAQIAL